MKKRGLGNLKLAVNFLILSFAILFTVGILTSQFTSEESENPASDQITANAIMYSTENSIIVPGMTADLQNAKEGTIIWWTKPEMKVFSEFKSQKEYLLMFISNNLDGLVIGYHYDKEAIFGGTPTIFTPKILFFDGTSHQIGYTFRQGGNQQLYYDGALLAESKYVPMESIDMTGNMIRQTIPLHPVDLVEKTQSFAKVLTPEEIKALQ